MPPVGQTGPASVTEPPDGRENAPLKPQLSAKLARSVSNRTTRPQRCNRLPPPDGGWGWMVLLGVVIGNILIIGHAKTFGVYISTFIERFNEKPSTVAWIQSIQFSFFLGFAPVASILAERFSPRTVTFCGAAIACAGMSLSSQAKTLTHLYFSYGMLMGLACVFTFTPGVIMIAKYFDRRRGLANGLGMAGNSLGGIFMPIIADHLLSEYSLHGGLLIMGGILLNAAVGAMLWRPVESTTAYVAALKRQSRVMSTGPRFPQTSQGVPNTGPIPSLSARTPSSTADTATTPLMFDVREQEYVNGVLPEEAPSDFVLSLASAPPQPSTQPTELSVTPLAPASSVSPVPISTASAPPYLPPVSSSTSVPDISVPCVQSTFEVQSQPSTSPPPLPLSTASQRKKEQRVKEHNRPLETQQSLDHQSIFSQSTASLSSFVYLSTFHLGPSYGTVEDITNLDYDDEDEADGELYGLTADSASDDDSEEEEDYDVYETVRARSDLRIDITGLLAASGGVSTAGTGTVHVEAGSAAGGEVKTNADGPAAPVQGAKGLEVILQPKKAVTPTLENVATAAMEQVNEVPIVLTDGSQARSASRRKQLTIDRTNSTNVSIKPATGDGITLARGGSVAKTRNRPPPSARLNRPGGHSGGNKYLDFSFFHSSVFYVMMVPLFLHNIGYPTIQMYTPLYARSLGFSTSDSARCLSFLAFADVVGRIGCAWLSDLHLCKRKYFYMAGMFLSGLVAYFMPLTKTYVQLLLCTSGFGLASGAYIGLTVALFADAFGNEMVAKAHSMATMCTGIAGLAGGPFIGYVLEKTNSFFVCYAILGSCQILGGLVYLLEPWAAQIEANKQRTHQWV
ncbi:uncharacterized protein LOC111252791 isoform X2 [Varroa destructor]|nr:uncharacterized protein LOC111252791 isoform X2 [Varroa destructor]